VKLGARLQKAADFVGQGAVLADIGTDHAYLPIYLAKQNKISRAFACDVSQGPLEGAKRAIAAAGLAEKITACLGDGLNALPKENNVDTAVLAGMGGATMAEILENARGMAEKIKRLIFQPMNDGARLRRWLAENGWRIIDEELAFDEGRLYEIICAERGSMTIDSDILFEIGPVLKEKKHPLLKEHITALLEKSKKILQGMAESAKARQSERYAAEERRKNELEAELKWL
jgi:tRNA (adenine22-N1)-methyltransferase